MLDPIPYIEWLKDNKAKIKHDLGSTGLKYFEKQKGCIPPFISQDKVFEENNLELNQYLAKEYQTNSNKFLITTGVTFGNYLVFTKFVEKVDKFLIEQPAYQPLYYTPKSLPIKIERIKRREKDNYSINREELKEKLDEKSLIVLSNRHNPSGRLLSSEEIKELSEIASQNDSFLLVDEVYSQYTVKDNFHKTAFASPTAIDYENTLITNSLSKFFGMGDLKIGWVGADEEIIEELEKIYSHFFTVSSPSKKLAKEVFENKEKVLNNASNLFKKNSSLLQNFVQSRKDLKGKVYGTNSFAFLRKKEINGKRLAKKCLKDNLLIMPGQFFGDKHKFRISVSEKPMEAQKSIEKLEKVLNKID